MGKAARCKMKLKSGARCNLPAKSRGLCGRHQRVVSAKRRGVERLISAGKYAGALVSIIDLIKEIGPIYDAIQKGAEAAINSGILSNLLWTMARSAQLAPGYSPRAPGYYQAALMEAKLFQPEPNRPEVSKFVRTVLKRIDSDFQLRA